MVFHQKSRRDGFTGSEIQMRAFFPSSPLTLEFQRIQAAAHTHTVLSFLLQNTHSLSFSQKLIIRQALV